MKKLLAASLALVLGCGPVGSGGSGGSGAGGSGGGAGGNGGSNGSGGAGGGSGGAGGSGGGGGQAGCGELTGCFTVYAHGDHVLYHVDLVNKMLVQVGPFNAPTVGSGEDVITDLAVSPDDRIYVISNTNLYTADAMDGHVTLVGPVTACGMKNVGMTFTADGKLYSADFMGAFCNIDLTTTPPTVRQVGSLGQGLALSGDLVAVSDGTVFGTAYRLTDAANMGTQVNNLLVKLDPSTGQVTQMMGQTGYPKLFGVAFSQGKVFAFTHDGSGDVVTIDPATGQGTLYATFMDPMTGRGISFAGAGVDPMVPIVSIHE